jgi:hypothetical protein
LNQWGNVYAQPITQPLGQRACHVIAMA